MLQEIFARQADRPARRRLQPARCARRRRRSRGIAAGFAGLSVAVQHRRPLLLGVAVGQDRPQEHLLHVLHPRHRALRAGADLRGDGLEAAVRARLRHYPVDVWRRLRDGAGLSSPTCSAPSSWAPSTAGC